MNNCVLCFIAATAAVEGKLAKPLKKVLKTIVAKNAHESLAVADAKLGLAIKVSLLTNCSKPFVRFVA